MPHFLWECNGKGDENILRCPSALAIVGRGEFVPWPGLHLPPSQWREEINLRCRAQPPFQRRRCALVRGRERPRSCRP